MDELLPMPLLPLLTIMGVIIELPDGAFMMVPIDEVVNDLLLANNAADDAATGQSYSLLLSRCRDGKVVVPST